MTINCNNNNDDGDNSYRLVKSPKEVPGHLVNAKALRHKLNQDFC